MAEVDTDRDADLSQLPFVAPCHVLPAAAPLTWLRLGWHDLRRAPVPSLSIGITVAVLSIALSVLGLRMGGYWVELVLLSGFVFVGPVLAIGLYATSRELEAERRPGFGISVREMRRDFSTLMVFALVLLIVFLVWARAATGLHVFMPDDGQPQWREYLPFLAIGSVVGTLFAGITFAASAFSLPMIMDRRVDAVTAVVTSVHAVLANRRAMLCWAALIVAALLAGFLTGMIGLAVTIPLIGHATWHGYRATIDARAYPPQPLG